MSDFVIDANGRANIFKDPQAVLDYVYDWTTYLADISDTLATITIVADTGITVNSSAILPGNLKAIVWLSGGTLGVKYAVTCHMTTAGGRTDDRTFYVKIKDK